MIQLVVLVIGKQKQIVQLIVGLVAINVVYMLMPFERTPYGLLHHHTVLWSVIAVSLAALTVTYLDHHVTIAMNHLTSEWLIGAILKLGLMNLVTLTWRPVRLAVLSAIIGIVVNDRAAIRTCFALTQTALLAPLIIAAATTGLAALCCLVNCCAAVKTMVGENLSTHVLSIAQRCFLPNITMHQCIGSTFEMRSVA